MAVIQEDQLDPKNKALWFKAIAAAEQRNFDYVITLLKRVVAEVPEFLDGRKSLRKAETQRIKSNVKGGTKVFGLTIGGSGGPSASTATGLKAKSLYKKEPFAAIIEIEDLLEKEPYHPDVNGVLYDIATKLGMNELASFALETVREGFPSNTKNLHKLAEHYLRLDEPDKAIEVYNQIKNVDPTDMDAAKGERDASARASMKKGAWDSNLSLHERLKDKDEAAKLDNESRAALTPDQLRQRLETLFVEYQEDNHNINTVKRIADTYEKLEEISNAIPYYEWALQLSPGDVSLDLKITLLKQRAEEEEINRLEADILANPDAPDAAQRRQELEEIKRARVQRLIDDAQLRVDRNPTDRQARYDLAFNMFKAERYTDAIPHLQQAKANPNLRSKSVLLLARCFERKNMNDMSVNQFQEAIKELTIMDEVKKEALYELGLVFAKMGNQDASLECMKEIYNVDYGYRDVAQRVEQSYSGV